MSFLEKQANMPFGVIVSAFTYKQKIIRLPEKDEEDGVPKGVTFRVSNWKGYRISPLNVGTDEVLFEIDNEFAVERTKEVAEVEVRCCQTSV